MKDPSEINAVNRLAEKLMEVAGEFASERDVDGLTREEIEREISWALNFVDAHTEDLF